MLFTNYLLMPNTGNANKTNLKVRDVVFIDRDGVINEDVIGDYIKRWEDFHFIKGSREALQKLTRAGFEIVIVSNQAGIGDGIYPESALKEITQKMLDEFQKDGVKIAGIYYCLHGKNENCECRKPKTGLFERAAKEICFNRSESYFVGDKKSDVEAGKKFGLRMLFVLTGHGTNDQKHLNSSEPPEQILPSLKEAVEYIIATRGKKQ